MQDADRKAMVHASKGPEESTTSHILINGPTLSALHEEELHVLGKPWHIPLNYYCTVYCTLVSQVISKCKRPSTRGVASPNIYKLTDLEVSYVLEERLSMVYHFVCYECNFVWVTKIYYALVDA